MGDMGPLRWTAFNQWAERHGIAGRDYDDSWALLKEMDAEYLDMHAERFERARQDK